MELLKRAMMDSVVGSRFCPASLLARAIGYQVPARGALGKSVNISVGPAAPRVAPFASQGVSGSKFARMTISTLLLRRAAQTAAAALKTLSRCWPRVVPVLPPTGVAGVVSLKPSPAPSLFLIV